MKNFVLSLIVACGILAPAASSFAQAPAPAAAAAAPAPKDPTIEQRLADVEAYINNGARTANVAGKVAGSGPGHNAWQMTCAALVLFMTLPGLALFYGGLVRRKNVLSVLAQCLGIAGLVTIVWWLFGYIMACHDVYVYMGKM